MYCDMDASNISSLGESIQENEMTLKNTISIEDNNDLYKIVDESHLVASSDYATESDSDSDHSIFGNELIPQFKVTCAIESDSDPKNKVAMEEMEEILSYELKVGRQLNNPNDDMLEMTSRMNTLTMRNRCNPSENELENLVPNSNILQSVLQELTTLFSSPPIIEDENWTHFGSINHIKSISEIRQAVKLYPSHPLPKRLQIMDYLITIKALFQREMNTMLTKDWDNFLEFCCSIPVTDYLAFIILEFSDIFSKKCIDIKTCISLVSRLLDNLNPISKEVKSDLYSNPNAFDTLDEQIFMKQSEAYSKRYSEPDSSIRWMSTLALEVLVMNVNTTFNNSSKILHNEDNTKKTPSNFLNADCNNLEDFYQNIIQSHENYHIFYAYICEGLVSHSHDDIPEYNCIQFRFISCIFTNGTLSRTVFYKNDMECIMKALVEALCNFAEVEESQFLFDEISATLIDILSSRTYKEEYDFSMIELVRTAINDIESNRSGGCCSNAIENCYFLRKHISDL